MHIVFHHLKKIAYRQFEVLFGGILERSVTLAYTCLLMYEIQDKKMGGKIGHEINQEYPLKTEGTYCYNQSKKSNLLFTNMMNLADFIKYHSLFSHIIKD